MTLIIVLCACFFDRFLGWPVALWRLRVRLLLACQSGLERLLGRWSVFHGPTGVVLYCAPFLLLGALVLFLLGLLNETWFADGLRLVVLIAGLGPQNLARLFDGYFHATSLADEERIANSRRRLLEGSAPGAGEEAPNLRFVLLESNRRLFAVLFWFVVLDIYGVLLYAVVRDLGCGLADRQGGFRASLADLQALLDWPVMRLQALGSVLAGDWGSAQKALLGLSRWWTLGANEAVLCQVAGAALGAGAAKPGQETLLAGLALMRRLLIGWLLVIALVVITTWVD